MSAASADAGGAPGLGLSWTAPGNGGREQGLAGGDHAHCVKSRSAVTSLSRKPLAPVRSASSTYSSRSNVGRMRTRGPGSGPRLAAWSPRPRPGRHLDVHQHHVVPQLAAHPYHLAAVGRGAAYGEVRLRIEQDGRIRPASPRGRRQRRCRCSVGRSLPGAYVPPQAPFAGVPSLVARRSLLGWFGEKRSPGGAAHSSSLVMGAAWSGLPRPSRGARH